MAENQLQLFEDRKYKKYAGLLEQLDCDVDQASTSQPLLLIKCNNQLTVQYAVVSSLNHEGLTSRYVEDDLTEDVKWVPQTAQDNEILGFLYGVTRLQTAGSPILLHIFAHATDVDGSSIGILLSDITSVQKAGELEYSLVSAKHDAEVDGITYRYDVPILRDNKTNEWLTKPATAEDVAAAISALTLPRTVIYTADSKHLPTRQIESIAVSPELL